MIIGKGLDKTTEFIALQRLLETRVASAGSPVLIIWFVPHPTKSGGWKTKYREEEEEKEEEREEREEEEEEAEEREESERRREWQK